MSGARISALRDGGSIRRGGGGLHDYDGVVAASSRPSRPKQQRLNPAGIGKASGKPGSGKAGNGKAELTTVQGGKLWAMMDGKKLVLKDEKGMTSTVTIADVNQSNGVIHVVDTVLMHK